MVYLVLPMITGRDHFTCSNNCKRDAEYWIVRAQNIERFQKQQYKGIAAVCDDKKCKRALIKQDARKAQLRQYSVIM